MPYGSGIELVVEWHVICRNVYPEIPGHFDANARYARFSTKRTTKISRQYVILVF